MHDIYLHFKRQMSTNIMQAIFWYECAVVVVVLHNDGTQMPEFELKEFNETYKSKAKKRFAMLK